jgi:hypothetical protein
VFFETFCLMDDFEAHAMDDETNIPGTTNKFDTIFKFTGRQHANPDDESATNRATKTGRQKVCQRHNNQPAGVWIPLFSRDSAASWMADYG